MTYQQRQPHAVLDLPTRRNKGMKIERLLHLNPREKPIRLVEIRTGSGGIAYYFAAHPKPNCQVTAVDVMDNRFLREGFNFNRITDTSLPFTGASFNVVLTDAGFRTTQ